MTEQRSRIQKEGGHCLSPSRSLRTGSASLPAAECGEQHRESGGSRQGPTGFGSFCRNKRTSAAGPRPGKKSNKVFLLLFSLIRNKFSLPTLVFWVPLFRSHYKSKLFSFRIPIAAFFLGDRKVWFASEKQSSQIMGCLSNPFFCRR